MFRTEVNLLNTICKTEFFQGLALRTEKLNDYSLILEEYCLFLRYQQEGVLLNEPRLITYKASPHIFDPEYLSPAKFFTSQQIYKINQTIEISNILIQPFTASNTYQLIKDLDNDLVSSLFFFQDSYSFLDVIVFSSLQKCRIWPKLYKESRKSKKELPLLIDWFKVFMTTYKHQIEYQFHPSIVAEKYQKKLEQQTKERRQDKELIEAVRTSNYAEISKLIESGSDIESIESRMYMRAAHIACELGNIDLCRFLDKLNCDWSSLDKELQTPIYYAVSSNNLEIVKFLVEEKHVDHQHKEFQNRTPFYLACFLGNMPMIEYLYSKGVNVNEPSKLKRCALSKACYLGHIDVVQFLVNCPGIDLVLQDSKGRTAMHNAAWGVKGGKEGKKRGTILLPDSPQSIKILHDHGHSIDILDLEGNSALMSAASSDAQDSLKVLIERGANKHIQNIYKENSVFLAAKFGHLDMIKLLVEEYHIEWWLRDNQDTSALEIAGMQLHFDCMEYLLDLEIKDKRFLNPEHFLNKIQDDYLKEADQVAVFKKYSSKVDFAKEIGDLIFLGNFIENCRNFELLMAVINTVIDKLSSEQMQSLLNSILKESSKTFGENMNATNGKSISSIHPILANKQITNDNSQIEELIYQKPIMQQEKQQQQYQIQSRKIQTVLMIYQMYVKVNIESTKTIVLDKKLVFDELLNGNSQPLTEEELKVLLFECNLDWIHYKDEITGNTFLHVLCQKRLTKAVMLFLQLITEMNLKNKSTGCSELDEEQVKKNQESLSLSSSLQLGSDAKLSFTITNKFLVSTELSNLAFIRSYFESLNFAGLHVLDVCILSRFNDIHLILQSFLGNLLSSAPASHYSIPQYTLTQGTQITNPIVKQILK